MTAEATTTSNTMTIIKDEPMDLISHQTDDTSAPSSSYFGSNNHLHHQYHHHHPGYYPSACSSSFQHQQNPSDNLNVAVGGYQRSVGIYQHHQPAAGNSNHHQQHLIQNNNNNKAASSSGASISSPSPSPNGSNCSYVSFGSHQGPHHHPSAYSYHHGSVAVPLAHSLHHQQPGGSHHHHLSAGRFAVHHSPFAHHHHRQAGPSTGPNRGSVSTPPCSPQVVPSSLETLNNVHHNPLQLHHHHHHPHLIHGTATQQQQPLTSSGPATQTTSTGQQGPVVKAKRGKIFEKFKFPLCDFDGEFFFFFFFF